MASSVSGNLPLRERKKAITRQALIDAAERLFEDRGFDAVTVAEIADAANVSVKTLFVYFRSKEDLAFADQGLIDAFVAALAARAPGTSAAAAIAEVLLDAIEGGDVQAGIEGFHRGYGRSTALESGLLRMWSDYEDRITAELAREAAATPPTTPETSERAGRPEEPGVWRLASAPPLPDPTLAGQPLAQPPAGHLEPSQSTPGQMQPSQPTPGHMQPSQPTPGHMQRGQPTPDQLRPGHPLGQLESSQPMPDQMQPGQLKPGRRRVSGSRVPEAGVLRTATTTASTSAVTQTRAQPRAAGGRPDWPDITGTNAAMAAPAATPQHRSHAMHLVALARLMTSEETRAAVAHLPPKAAATELKTLLLRETQAIARAFPD